VETLHTSLRPHHRQELTHRLDELQSADQWHGGLPVLLLDRCWLRLSSVRLEQLANRLPPDSSREAPELQRYRDLVAAGEPEWLAQQLCWEEFGSEACREALRRFWLAQEQATLGWSLDRYLALVHDYRRRFHTETPRSLPLMLLARAGEREHRLHWLAPESHGISRSMRHTCA
jgi:hypothetical protein